MCISEPSGSQAATASRYVGFAYHHPVSRTHKFGIYNIIRLFPSFRGTNLGHEGRAGKDFLWNKKYGLRRMAKKYQHVRAHW